MEKVGVLTEAKGKLKLGLNCRVKTGLKLEPRNDGPKPGLKLGAINDGPTEEAAKLGEP